MLPPTTAMAPEGFWSCCRSGPDEVMAGACGAAESLLCFEISIGICCEKIHLYWNLPLSELNPTVPSNIST